MVDDDVAPPARVERVSVKVPPFWAEDPVLWFAQIERQFVCAGVTQESSKFDIVTSALERRYATAVRALILNPPVDGRYEELKLQLVRRFSPSLDARLQQLFQHEEMGDRSPSQFLAHMKILGGPDVSDTTLRVLWLSRMPQRMSSILAASPPGDLEALAVIADRIHERAVPGSRVASIDTPATLPSCQEQLDELIQQVAALSADRSAAETTRTRSAAAPANLPSCQEQLDELVQQVAALSAGRSAVETTRTRSANQQHATSAATRDTVDGAPGDEMCWFHRTFGDRAKRCRKPCSFRAKNSTGRQ
jgi:hypothetical protein